MSDNHEDASPGTEFNPQSGYPVPGPADDETPVAPPMPPPPYGQQQPYQQQAYPQQPYGLHGQQYPQNPYVPGQPYPPGQGYPGYPAYPGQAAPDLPEANTAFVLGLVGLIGGFFCVLPILVSPFAWLIGARARRRIRESNGQLGGESKATTGFILGIIGTALLILGLIAVAVIIVIVINADPDPTFYDDGGYTDL